MFYIAFTNKKNISNTDTNSRATTFTEY